MGGAVASRTLFAFLLTLPLLLCFSAIHLLRAA